MTGWARVAVVVTTVWFVACDRPDAARFSAVGAAATALSASESDYPVEIVHPPTLGLLDTDLRDVRGARVGVACATCHSAGAGAALARRDGRPEGMHAHVALQHGSLKCGSCHRQDTPDVLVLADGENVPMQDYMRLCAQCHGPQYRDYSHGSHGGMKGYWDLKRGPRQRNSCVACHAAHAPAYPHVIPAPGPIDRFLESKHEPGAVFERRFAQEGVP